jgi:predicted NUDIX family phosphoesterase
VCLTGIILEELVFAIPTDTLWKLLPYKETGLIKGNSDVLSRIAQNGLFRKRSELEKDSSFKQLIPYAIISNKDSFYLFRRTAGQTEKRLHNKLHLGVGGHMNPGRSNEPDEQYLIDELKRELFEEVELLNDCVIEDIEFIGFINDDSVPVGRVHLGLLYIIHLSDQDIVINETDKMTAFWTDKTDLIKYYEVLETWTKIAIESYIERRGNQK